MRVTADHATHDSARIVVELDEKNRLVINLRRWSENDARAKQLRLRRHFHFHTWDFWILWERRKTPRHRWSNAATGWLGQATLDTDTGDAGPLVQWEPDEEAPQGVDSQVRLET